MVFRRYGLIFGLPDRRDLPQFAALSVVDGIVTSAHLADVAQLVEHLVANEKVAGSNLVVRSKKVLN